MLGRVSPRRWSWPGDGRTKTSLNVTFRPSQCHLQTFSQQSRAELGRVGEYLYLTPLRDGVGPAPSIQWSVAVMCSALIPRVNHDGSADRMQHAALQHRLQAGWAHNTAALHGINQYRTITSCACTAETDITSLNTGCHLEDTIFLKLT